MIIVLKKGTRDDQREHLISWLKRQGVAVDVSKGTIQTILGIVGDVASIDKELVSSLEIVEAVRPVSDPFKRCNRKFHPDDTIVEVGNAVIGGGNFVNIAGPSAVESEEQILEVAKSVKNSGANLLYGGAFMSRTSPYAFQGLQEEGLELLKLAKKETGLPVVSEIIAAKDMKLYDDIDMVMISSKNMQNYDLLREVGSMNKPVLLKRGVANTINELLMSAEYIYNSGNSQIILCERGVRTFDMDSKITLDLSVVPMLHERTHLPVIVDASRSCLTAKLTPNLAMASVAGGCDGLLIQVHNDPQNAVCDGARSMNMEDYSNLAKKVFMIREVVKE